MKRAFLFLLLALGLSGCILGVQHDLKLRPDLEMAQMANLGLAAPDLNALAQAVAARLEGDLAGHEVRIEPLVQGEMAGARFTATRVSLEEAQAILRAFYASAQEGGQLELRREGNRLTVVLPPLSDDPGLVNHYMRRTLRLQVPGRVLETNGEQEGQALIWREAGALQAQVAYRAAQPPILPLLLLALAVAGGVYLWRRRGLRPSA